MSHKGIQLILWCRVSSIMLCGFLMHLFARVDPILLLHQSREQVGNLNELERDYIARGMRASGGSGNLEPC